MTFDHIAKSTSCYLTLFVIFLPHWISLKPLNPTQIQEATIFLRSLCKPFPLPRTLTFPNSAWLASYPSGLNFPYYLCRKTFCDNHQKQASSYYSLFQHCFYFIHNIYQNFVGLFGLHLFFFCCCFVFIIICNLIHEEKDFACLVYLVPRMHPGTQQILNNYFLNVEQMYQREVLEG